MKKCYLFLSILTLAFMASCQNEELLDAPMHAGSKVEVTATLADAGQSRTHHSDDHTKVLWSENDAISVFTVGDEPCHDRYYLTSGVGTASAKFQWDKAFNGTITGGIEGDASLQESFYIGVYPFMEGTSVKVSEGNYEVNTMIPTNQKYAENSFGQESFVMVGVDLVNAKPNIAFKNVGTILIFPLKGEGTIQTATLKSEKSKISGQAVVTVSAGNGFIPSANMENGESEITLSCGEGVQLKGEEYTKFCFVLAPGVYDDLVVKFTDTYGNYFEQKIENPNGKEMARSMSYNMPKMTFEAQGTEEIDLWVKAKAGANMTAQRIIPTLTDVNIEEWVTNLSQKEDPRALIEEVITYIGLKNYEAAYDALGGIPGFVRDYKTFDATGSYIQKVDFTGAGYAISFLDKIDDVKDIHSLIKFMEDFEKEYKASGLTDQMNGAVGNLSKYFDEFLDAFVNGNVKGENPDYATAIEAYRAKVIENLNSTIKSADNTIATIEGIRKISANAFESQYQSIKAYRDAAVALKDDLTNNPGSYATKESIEEAVKALPSIEAIEGKDSTEVESKKAELATLNADLATLQEQLATLNASLATLNTELTTLQGQLKTLQDEFAAKNEGLTARKNQLQTELDALIDAAQAERENQVKALQAELATLETELANMKATLAANKEAKLATLRQELAELEEKYEKASGWDKLTIGGKIAKKELEISSVENDWNIATDPDILAQDAKIAAKKLEITAKEKEELTNDDITAKEAEIAKVDEELKGMNDVAIQAKQAEVDAKQAEVDAKQSEVNSKNGEISLKKTAISLKEGEIKLAESQQKGFSFSPMNLLTGADEAYNGLKTEIDDKLNINLSGAQKALLETFRKELANFNVIDEFKRLVAKQEKGEKLSTTEEWTMKFILSVFSEDNKVVMDGVKKSLRSLVETIEEAAKDSVNNGNVSSKQAAIQMAKNHALKMARMDAMDRIEDLYNMTNEDNINNLGDGSWGRLKRILNWKKCVELFEQFKMMQVYNALLDLVEVVEEVVRYDEGEYIFDISNINDYQENVDWWVLKFNEEL